MAQVLTCQALAVAFALVVGGVPAFAGEAGKADRVGKESAKATPQADAKATKADVAKADQDRKKPLQRCDQLKDKAQIDCLEKARERIVDARQKREASGKGSAQK